MPRSFRYKFKKVLNRDINKLCANINITNSESIEKKALEIRTALQAYPNVDLNLSMSSPYFIEFKFKCWDCFSINENCKTGKFHVPQDLMMKNTVDQINPTFRSIKKLGLFLKFLVGNYLIPHKIPYFYYVHCRPNSVFKLPAGSHGVYVNHTSSDETWKRRSILEPHPLVPVEVNIPHVLSSFIYAIDPKLKGTEKQNHLRESLTSVKIAISIVISKENTATEIEIEHTISNFWENEDCTPLGRTIEKLFGEKLKPFQKKHSRSSDDKIKLMLDQDISIRFDFL